MVSSAAWACIVKLRSDDDAPQSDPLVSDGLKSISVGSCFAMRSSAITCEKESEVRSENDSEEEETYLREDGVDQVLLGLLLPRQQSLPLLFLPQHERPLSLHHPLVQVRGAAPLIPARRRARSEARTTARRRRLTLGKMEWIRSSWVFFCLVSNLSLCSFCRSTSAL